MRLLLIDDNPRDRELLARELHKHFAPLEIMAVRDGHEFEEALARVDFDAVILDYQVRWTTALEILPRIRLIHPHCPILMFTASGSEDVAVQAMKEGLDDYITKTAKHYGRLPFALQAALERRAQRRELARAGLDSAHLAAIVQYSNDPIISQTLDGLVLSWNEGARRLYGYTEAEMVGQPLTRLIPPELREQAAKALARVAQGEAVPHFETERIAQDGRRLFVSVSVSPIRDPSGKVVYASKLTHDLTQRKQMEDTLREADRRKDAFVATLAHELRNPLAPIRYATRLLEPGVPEQMAQDARRMIDRQLAHMARLLDDLLDVSRLTRGVLEIRREVIDLRETIEAAVAAARILAKTAEVELMLELPDRPLPVCGDATRLAQIVGNLVGNAIKYTARYGHVRVEARAEAADALIRVVDDGMGIAPEMLPKIFELFVQADPNSTRAAGGLGIGLSLARELVHLHEGSIGARSAGMGQGSEFWVRLPRAAEPPALAQAVAEPKKVRVLGAARSSVLVVDDNRDAADSLSHLLSCAGYQTRVAYDARTGFEIARQLRPDVALLDIGLPQASGHELARNIRAQAWGADVQLIAITGWGQAEDRRRSLESGFNAHLTKPVDPAVLLDLIVQRARDALAR